MSPNDPGFVHNARPFPYGSEETALCEALHSGYYNHSAVTDRFEAEVARFLDVRDTVAVASGTAALHVALLAIGIGAGDEVIVPSFTFCATVQAILATGATPRFADIDPRTLCTGSAQVLDALTPNTRAVMPVLYAGRAVDLSDARPALADRGITIIEDAAHAFGSSNGDRRVGATGDVTCFSFGPIKNLTCGQGGMIVPRTPAEADACRKLRSLGIAEPAAARADLTAYTVGGLGLRVQMPSLNAAIGLAQLAHFTEAETKRKHLWHAYAAALHDLDGVVLADTDIDRSVPHLCAVRVLQGRRGRVFRALRERGIGAGTHYPPNHLQPAFAPWHRSLPVTEQIGREIMTLPGQSLTLSAGRRHPRRPGQGRRRGVLGRHPQQARRPPCTPHDDCDLTAHRGVQVSQDLLDWADTVLAMDRSNLAALHHLANERCPCRKLIRPGGSRCAGCRPRSLAPAPSRGCRSARHDDRPCCYDLPTWA
jgi:perosamine synthetase